MNSNFAVLFFILSVFALQGDAKPKPFFGGFGCGCPPPCPPPVSYLPIPQPTPIPFPIQKKCCSPPQSVTIPNIILALLPPTSKPSGCSKPCGGNNGYPYYPSSSSYGYGSYGGYGGYGQRSSCGCIPQQPLVVPVPVPQPYPVPYQSGCSSCC